MTAIVVTEQVAKIVVEQSSPKLVISYLGQKGDSGEGVPTGGTTNQALLKNSNANYDASFKTILLPANNLSDVVNATTARQNLGAISEGDAIAIYLSL